MKNIIISGANGFIGSSLIKKCIENNIRIVAISDSFNNNRIPNNSLITKIEATVEDEDALLSLIPKDNYDAFYHLAWNGVNANDRDNFKIQVDNINLCLKYLKLASLIKAKKFILPGSTSEYLYYNKPINKNAIPSPQNAYGSVKVATRYLASQYAKELNIDFIYVVITGIYAADRKDNNVIYYTIDKLLRGETPHLTKLEQKWDYVNIKDAINALYLIGENGKSGSFYTIGHGDNWELYKYINEIKNIINPDAKLGIGDISYSNDILPSSCVDLSKIKEDCGYEPSIDFKHGIKEVINKLKEEMNNE